MKKMVLSLFLCGAIHAAIIGDFPLSPGANFVYQSPLDNCPANNSGPDCTDAGFFSPTVLDLASLGLVAGEQITLTRGGWLCFYAGSDCRSYAPDIGGLFSTSATLLGPRVQDRVPGAIEVQGASPIGDNQSLDTYYDYRSTKTAFAFYINSVTLTVPPNAQYLFLNILDSFRSDNSGAPWVRIETVPDVVTPESATWGLTLAGIGVMALRRR